MNGGCSGACCLSTRMSSAANATQVWIYNEQARRWLPDGTALTGHTGALIRLPSAACCMDCCLVPPERACHTAPTRPRTLATPADWVRDVAWAPSFGLPKNTLASAGQDGKVFIWTERPEGASMLPACSCRLLLGVPPCLLCGCWAELRAGLLQACFMFACAFPAWPHTLPQSLRVPPAGGWEKHLLHDFGAPVWRVSWSVSGNILSVSDAANAVTLWKEAADGTWQQITQ